MPTRRGATSWPTRSRGHRRRPRDGGQADPQGSPVRREAPALRHGLLRGRTTRPTSSWSICRRHRWSGSTADGHRDRPTRIGNSTWSCGRPASTSAPAPWPAWASGGGAAMRSWTHWADGPQDVPRHSDHRVPQLLLPRRAARRRRQQSPLQRRPGGVRHRHAMLHLDGRRLRRHRGRRRPQRRSGPPWWTAGGRGPGLRRERLLFGTNIPGKPRNPYLGTAAGRPKLLRDNTPKSRRPTTRPSPSRGAPRPRPTRGLTLPGEAVQTVATGVRGEPTRPGQPQQRNSRSEKEAVVILCSRSHPANWVQMPPSHRAGHRDGRGRGCG